MLDFVSEELSIFGDIFLYILPVVPVTIKLTLISFGLAQLLGFLIALGRSSGIRPLMFLLKAWVDVIRGVPLLVQIFFIYFGIGHILNLSQFAAGIVAISICYSAYSAEVIRAGFASIHKGQYEAAYSLGMTKWQCVRHVVVPQSLKSIIPPMANELIACLKDSSLVSIVGLREITRAGREYYSARFVDFEVWLCVALIYLAMTLTLSRLIAYLERRFQVHGFGTR